MKIAKGRILIVDDEPRWGRSSKLALEREGYEVELVQNMEEARRLIEHNDFTLIVINSALALDKEAVLRKAVRRYPEKVVVMSDTESIPTAIRVLKLGADYETKPFEEANLIELIGGRAQVVLSALGEPHRG